ncbi:aldehyde dehydrogenase family protein [Denitromonas iodatirespirans]|uniref:Aldehyde dehydrogenase family protein n=1 Tax=Denitromonas iodatirespirans TaxID=2795389 RepID=A0A944DAS9_DENI1|nr:aldehyde dehydrogenase family protein [Denitromonas iodatirespirans]MBT0961596.1 aldehyde dehydrogenase family protein [Denitromonas iodatirespirans]
MDPFDPAKIAVPNTHFIGGRAVGGARETLDVHRPSDGKLYAALPLADANLVDHAVEDAWRAFKESDWATRAPRDRARVLHRWADLIEADVATLAPLEALGSTRPIHNAANWDVPFCAEGIRFFAEFADKCGGEVVPTQRDQLGMTVTEPYGVIGAIAPWNFPLVMASWKIAPALAAGNAVVLKPSEMTPFSIVRLAELAIAAGIPPGIFNIVQGDGRVGDALCRDPRIAKVTFTGSTRTGAAIMAACAESGTKAVTLELGGKSPQVVFADVADVDKVARRVAQAISTNAGQVCVAGSRLIVQRAIADQLVERIAAAFAELVAGPTWEATTTLSPIISAREMKRIDGIVRKTVEQGGQIVTGGGATAEDSGGAYYQPTILTGVDMNMDAVRDEIFGPVLTVQTFEDEAEAMQLAAHPSYGLAAGVHTADINRALRLARGLEAGTVWVNRYGRSWDFALPTGGYKRSGIGKDLGRAAYEANLRTKTVLIDFADDAA